MFLNLLGSCVCVRNLSSMNFKFVTKKCLICWGYTILEFSVQSRTFISQKVQKLDERYTLNKCSWVGCWIGVIISLNFQKCIQI